MAALAPVAVVASTGAAALGAVRQASAQRQAQAAQAQQEQARQAELVALAEQNRQQREATLARTVASTRARLGAAGIAPDDGSAGAVTVAMRQEAAAAQEATDEVLRLRLSRGRTSLLAPDGTLSAVSHLARGFGAATRSLLG